MENNQEEQKKKPFYKKWWVWILAVLILFIFTSLGNTQEKVQVVKQEAEKAVLSEAIEYSTLREWSPDNDSSAIGLEVLINPLDVSKDKITALAQSIGSQSDKVLVKVYKTQEAWDAEKNEVYGDVFNEGYIAFYVKNITNSGAYRGSNEVRWMQEIGELKDLFGSKTQVQ